MLNMTVFKRLPVSQRSASSGYFWLKNQFVSVSGFLILCGFGIFFQAVPSLASERHGMGFIPENPEKYAAMPEVSRYRAYYPPETDLSPYFPKPGNQGKQGSCVAWATAYATRSYLEARQAGRNPKTPDRIFSPAFIFNQLQEGGCDNGGSISDALALMKNTGAASLADFPYVEGNCSRLPDEQVLNGAAHFRIKNWKKVDTNRLDDIKGQLYAGNPVIVGMFVSESFENLKQNQLYDDLASPRNGGHAFVLVGYSEPKQAFKLINSWGGNWGDDGFGWISYRAFKKWSQNAFVMQPTFASALPDVAQESKITPAVYPEPADSPEVNPLPLPYPKPLPKPAVIPPAQTDIHKNQNNDLKRALARLLPEAKCAELHGAVDADGRISLSGFVGQRQDLNYIENELNKLGAKQVTLNTVLRPWPQCEALLTFRDVLAKPAGLKLSVLGHHAAVLNDGDKLNIEVKTPDYPSYLYLTYIQANGDAVLLSHPQTNQPKPLPPDTRLVLGSGEDGGPKFTIAPPYGNEMIIAVAAASPLFDEDLPKSQTEREYLTRFRQAFLTGAARGENTRIVSAAMTTLITRNKP